MCATILERFSPVHILVNNVGGRRENIATEQMSLADWQRIAHPTGGRFATSLN